MCVCVSVCVFVGALYASKNLISVDFTRARRGWKSDGDRVGESWISFCLNTFCNQCETAILYNASVRACVCVYVRTCACVCMSCVVVVAIAIALVGHRLAFNFRFYCVETIVWYWFGYELSESSPASACQDEHKHSVGGCRARNFPHLNIKFAWGSCFANACGSIWSVSRCLLKSNHNRTALILRTNLNEPIFPI